MTPKVEGTFLLDGLIEGPLPEGDGGDRLLGEWAAGMAALGLPIELEVTGGRYSLLASGKAVPRTSLPGPPATLVARELGHLVEALPPDARAGAFSTLRSADVHAGYEVQTLYVVGRDGAVETRERRVDVETAATTTTDARDRGRLTLIAALLAVAALLVSSFFVDYRSLVRGLWDRVTPLSPRDLEVRADAFGPWLRIVDVKVEDGGRTGVLTLERTADYPRSEAAVADALDAPEVPLGKRLALTALATGYVRCEVYARDGTFVGVQSVRVRGLEDSDTAKAKVALPADPRPRRLALVP